MVCLFPAAAQFAPPGRIRDIREYGRGNVHDTFLVSVDHPHPPLSLDFPAEKRFILQRVNTRVFPQPELVMGNIQVLTAHIDQRLGRSPLSAGRRWEVPRVLLTLDGQDHWVSPRGSFWRALSFIDGAESFDTIGNLEQAREAGYALGMFHHLLSDLPPGRLAYTLPGFHLTPRYLRHYEAVLAQHGTPPSPEVDYCLRFITKCRSWAPILENAKEQGHLCLRPIHGDPKVNNVMWDTATGQAVSLIDLDTVQPGLVHYDIGDLIRSGANPQGEETAEWDRVRFEPDLCRAILSGYLSLARDFLAASEYAYLYDAIRVIAFELGLRFFTDYLAGNVYFKVRYREHNLARALVQFKLTESLESQATAIRALIRGETPGRWRSL